MNVSCLICDVQDSEILRPAPDAVPDELRRRVQPGSVRSLHSTTCGREIEEPLRSMCSTRREGRSDAMRPDGNDER